MLGTGRSKAMWWPGVWCPNMLLLPLRRVRCQWAHIITLALTSHLVTRCCNMHTPFMMMEIILCTIVHTAMQEMPTGDVLCKLYYLSGKGSDRRDRKLLCLIQEHKSRQVLHLADADCQYLGAVFPVMSGGPRLCALVCWCYQQPATKWMIMYLHNLYSAFCCRKSVFSSINVSSINGSNSISLLHVIGAELRLNQFQ